jgi:hypothetical protein
MFERVGYGLASATAGLGIVTVVDPAMMIPAACVGALTAGYWKIGLADIKQSSHAIRRNYPVLGNLRYIFETIRPELRQYIVESDVEG